MRLKLFPHFDDLSLVFGKDSANGKWAMSIDDILEELDKDEASNNIEVDDLEKPKPMPLILVGKKQKMMTWL